jgi:thymidylate kinase
MAGSIDPVSPVAGLIAVVGCDGTGKSTLTADLVARLRRQRRTEWRYLGLVSGEMGDQIKRLPFVGMSLERRLAAKSEHAQNMRNQLPGAWAALIMYGFSLWRWSHLKKILRLTRHGVAVITDRYPQAEIPGFHYDGPGLGAGRSDNRLVHRLAAREQRLYQRMAAYRPALVIRLAIDADTAHQRKPDHSFTELRDKIAAIAQLRFNGARIVELDARASYAEVLEKAWQAVDATMATAACASRTA